MSDPCDLLQLFQLCRRRYAAALHPVERTWGLTRNEIDVILFLSNHPGLDTARDIVALRSLSKSHVCKSVDRLTRRGFLAGAQDAQTGVTSICACCPPPPAQCGRPSRPSGASFRRCSRR